jgi:hypothetical protein
LVDGQTLGGQDDAIDGTGKAAGFSLREIDRLKTVIRQSPLLDQSRKENTAEHTWHLAMYALVLGQFAKALDRFQPLLINIHTGGGTWTESGVLLEQVFSRYGPAIKKGAPELWAVCERWVTQHFSGQAPTAG